MKIILTGATGFSRRPCGISYSEIEEYIEGVAKQ